MHDLDESTNVVLRGIVATDDEGEIFHILRSTVHGVDKVQNLVSGGSLKMEKIFSHISAGVFDK